MPSNNILTEKDQIIIIYNHIVDYFEGDLYKTRIWFTTKKELLGGIAPIEMIQLGFVDRLYGLIDNIELYL